MTLPPAPPTLTRTRRTRSPLVLWHLVSLDAPTVAALWTWFLARATHIALPASSIAAMALAVWILYASDRLLDARLLHTHPLARSLELRHHFHHRHRGAFLAGIAAASIALSALLPRLAPAALRLYLIEGALLVGYFLLVHASHSAHRLPKELAVGLFFAAATFIPTVARDPSLRLPLLPSALLLAALCSLNCLFLYTWEHPSASVSPLTHPLTTLALRLLLPLSFAAAAAALTLTVLDRRAPSQIPAAIAVATLALLLLHRHRHRLHRTTLRAAADLVLLTPVLFLGS